MGLAAALRPSIQVVVIILSVITWLALAWLVRSPVHSERGRAFVESARAFAASDSYIIIHHILPHTITVTVVWATLSFLGVGVSLPTASWGNMIAEGQTRYRIAPWMIIVPIAAIRDALDPRTSQRQRF